jgi:IS1 family transposase
MIGLSIDLKIQDLRFRRIWLAVKPPQKKIFNYQAKNNKVSHFSLFENLFTNMSVRAADSWNVCLNTTLEQEDKEIYDIVENEKLRQWSGLELIASEVSRVCLYSFWNALLSASFYRTSLLKLSLKPTVLL